MSFPPRASEFAGSAAARITAVLFEALNISSPVAYIDLGGNQSIDEPIVFPPGVQALIAPAYYTVNAPVRIAQGAHVVGSGVDPISGAGTVFIAGSNLPAGSPVLLLQDDTGFDWWHWASLAWVRVEGDGRCDGILCNQPGENALIEHVLLNNCVSGLKITGICAGSAITKSISVFGCQVGINFDQVSSNHAGYCYKGDANKTILRVAPKDQQGGFTLQVFKLSGESLSDTDNDPFVLLEGATSGTTLTVHGFYPPQGNITKNDAVKIGGPASIVSVYDGSNAYGVAYKNVINDHDSAFVTAAQAGEIFTLLYDGAYGRGLRIL